MKKLIDVIENWIYRNMTELIAVLLILIAEVLLLILSVIFLPQKTTQLIAFIIFVADFLSAVAYKFDK